jgi:peptide/nickel transport system permease protein
MRRFLRSKAGVAGLVLLSAFILLALIGPLVVPYPNADRHWRDISWWQDSPAAAPPIWISNPWSSSSLPRSTTLRTADPLVAEGDDGSKLLTWTFLFPKGPPGLARDLVLRFYGEGSVFLMVTALKADGSKEEIVRESRDVPKDQEGRIALSGVTASGLAVAEYMSPGQAEPMPPTLLLQGKVSGLLGTDASKRDIFTGIVLGLRWALLLGVVVTFLTVLMGRLLWRHLGPRDQPDLRVLLPDALAALPDRAVDCL